MANRAPTVREIAELLDSWFPRRLAEHWDNTGLLLGDPDRSVETILTCLTITPGVVEEARELKANLIVSHHPILFRPAQKLVTTDPAAAVVVDLARHGIAVYSPHTAFDSAQGGINDMLAQAIGLKDVIPLRTTAPPSSYKVTVFVPENDLQHVLDAMFEAGAGVIGDYRECSFRVAGKGTFFGTESTSPTVGQKGRREEVDEWRVEVLCPGDRLAAVLKAMVDAHSYEEPAYDVYPLHALPPQSEGAGRIGTIEPPCTLDELARRVQSTLNAAAVGVVGTGDRPVSRLAIACGSGGSFLEDAARKGADALLTGEATFHKQLEAEARGVALILAGHFETERFGVERLANRLAHALPSTRVCIAQAERRPDRILVPS